MLTINRKEHDISTILSFNRRDDNYEKLIANVDPSTKTSATLLNEIENFSSPGIINPIALDKVSTLLSGKRKLVTNPECFLQQFKISDGGDIDSFFVKLIHEEYIDIEATSLRYSFYRSFFRVISIL